MIQTFRTRSERIRAIQFDGSNLGELEVAVKEVCDREAFFTPVMEVGCWVILTPPTEDRKGAYQVLPNNAFRSVYETDGANDLPPFNVVQSRTCLACKNFDGSRCDVWDEEIDSEILAAADCPDFTPEVLR